MYRSIILLKRTVAIQIGRSHLMSEKTLLNITAEGESARYLNE